MVVYERSGLPRVVNNAVIVTDVGKSGEKTTTFANIYDQREMQSGERQPQKLNGQRVIR